MDTSRTYKNYGIAFLTSIITFFISKLFINLYNAVDNFTLSLVLNKCFSEETYSYYLHPFLCWIIGKLSDILPFADAYLLTMHICVIIAISLLLFLVIDSDFQYIIKLYLTIITISFSMLFNIWGCNYTVQASFFFCSWSYIIVL